MSYGYIYRWDELEKWLSSGSYKSSDWARRQHMLKKYGLDKDITPDNLAAARQKADAIKKAAQDKEDKFHKDKYDAYWRAEDDDTMADFEKFKPPDPHKPGRFKAIEEAVEQDSRLLKGVKL